MQKLGIFKISVTLKKTLLIELYSNDFIYSLFVVTSSQGSKTVAVIIDEVYVEPPFAVI